MKKNAVPEISQKWWSKNKPITLKATGLGKKLGAYETALKSFEAAKTPEEITTTYSIVETMIGTDLPGAVDTAKQKCNAKLHADTIACLVTYKKTTFPAEAKRAAALLKGRQDVHAREVGAAKTKALKANKLMTTHLDNAMAAQTRLLSALGGIDKAKQLALKAKKANDDKTVAKAGEAAKEAIGAANKQYAEMQTILKTARATYGELRALTKSFPKDLEQTRKDTELLGDKIDSMVDEMTYEIKAGLKAENELRGIITGTMNEVDAINTTITQICKRFSMTHRTLQGTINQLGGPLEKVKFDLMNVKDKDGEAAEQELAKKLTPIVDAVGKKLAATMKLVSAATTALNGDLKSLPKGLKGNSAFTAGLEEVARTLDKSESMTKAVKSLAEDFKSMKLKVDKITA